MKLKKTRSWKRKGEATPSESSKPELLYQTRNPWNTRYWLIQEAQFSTHLILKDEIKKNQFKAFAKSKRNSNQKNNYQI